MTKTVLLVLLATIWSTAALAANKADAGAAITQAQTAVQAAVSADAVTAATNEMRAAQDNLTAALGASDRRNWDASVLNAQKAVADANLATARARQQRATSATHEIEASLETLRRETAQPGN